MIGIALALSFVIKTFFIQAFYIPSGSMENTLRIGDRVLVDKLTPWLGSTPSRGDVVVFRDPGDWLKDEPVPHVGGVHRALSLVGLMPSADEQDLIKRVIAVGGDTVKCTAGSPVSVNGVALDEPYLYPGATPCDNDSVGTVTVPKGKLWVMGDHRNDSADSRYHQLTVAGDGFVPLDHVIGRAVVVAWPVTHWATLPEPATFDQPRLQARATADIPETEAPGLLGLASAVPLTLWLRRRRTAATDSTPTGTDAPHGTE
ncbi:signal peptidase I [Saccharothrix sp. ST-888]|uniref:signal peptidase I n=1 Tax=Saccharothrix sp. ST-888 TaxID=1427391 RepID=UPI000B0DB178